MFLLPLLPFCDSLCPFSILNQINTFSPFHSRVSTDMSYPLYRVGIQPLPLRPSKGTSPQGSLEGSPVTMLNSNKVLQVGIWGSSL